MRREEADGGRRGRPEERGDRRVETATERGNNQIFRGLQRDPGRESKRRCGGILISIDAGK